MSVLSTFGLSFGLFCGVFEATCGNVSKLGKLLPV